MILASGSPRRAEILKTCGFVFDVIMPQADEKMDLGLPVNEACEKVALQKALEVCEKINEGVIVSADTIVVLDGQIMGKPVDDEDAFRMLKALSGKEHEVITAVTLAVKDTGGVKTDVFSESSKVFMKDITDEEIIEYIRTREPADKAGGYAVQGRGALFIEKIEGDFFNIMGLPVSRLYDHIKRLEIEIAQG